MDNGEDHSWPTMMALEHDDNNDVMPPLPFDELLPPPLPSSPQQLFIETMQMDAAAGEARTGEDNNSSGRDSRRRREDAVAVPTDDAVGTTGGGRGDDNVEMEEDGEPPTKKYRHDSGADSLDNFNPLSPTSIANTSHETDGSGYSSCCLTNTNYLTSDSFNNDTVISDTISMVRNYGNGADDVDIKLEHDDRYKNCESGQSDTGDVKDIKVECNSGYVEIEIGGELDIKDEVKQEKVDERCCRGDEELDHADDQQNVGGDQGREDEDNDGTNKDHDDENNDSGVQQYNVSDEHNHGNKEYECEDDDRKKHDGSDSGDETIVDEDAVNEQDIEDAQYDDVDEPYDDVNEEYDGKHDGDKRSDQEFDDDDQYHDDDDGDTPQHQDGDEMLYDVFDQECDDGDAPFEDEAQTYDEDYDDDLLYGDLDQPYDGDQQDSDGEDDAVYGEETGVSSSRNDDDTDDEDTMYDYSIDYDRTSGVEGIQNDMDTNAMDDEEGTKDNFADRHGSAVEGDDDDDDFDFDSDEIDALLEEGLPEKSRVPKRQRRRNDEENAGDDDDKEGDQAKQEGEGGEEESKIKFTFTKSFLKGKLN